MGATVPPLVKQKGTDARRGSMGPSLEPAPNLSGQTQTACQVQQQGGHWRAPHGIDDGHFTGKHSAKAGRIGGRPLDCPQLVRRALEFRRRATIQQQRAAPNVDPA